MQAAASPTPSDTYDLAEVGAETTRRTLGYYLHAVAGSADQAVVDHRLQPAVRAAVREIVRCANAAGIEASAPAESDPFVVVLRIAGRLAQRAASTPVVVRPDASHRLERALEALENAPETPSA